MVVQVSGNAFVFDIYSSIRVSIRFSTLDLSLYSGYQLFYQGASNHIGTLGRFLDIGLQCVKVGRHLHIRPRRLALGWCRMGSATCRVGRLTHLIRCWLGSMGVITFCIFWFGELVRMIPRGTIKRLAHALLSRTQVPHDWRMGLCGLSTVSGSTLFGLCRTHIPHGVLDILYSALSVYSEELDDVDPPSASLSSNSLFTSFCCAVILAGEEGAALCGPILQLWQSPESVHFITVPHLWQ